jgi:hypothetical protein
MRVLLFIFICLSLRAEPLQSPKGSELFPSKQIASGLAPAMSFAEALPPTGSVFVTNSFSWNGSRYADSYTLHQGTTHGGPYQPIAESMTTNVDAVVEWPEFVDRFFYVVTASNHAGESGYSNELAIPPLPYTHIILSWQGPRANILESATVSRPVWWLLTNAVSPVTLKMESGNYFFVAGTNQLSITGTNL